VSYKHKVESRIDDNSLDFQQVTAELYIYANTYIHTLTPRVAKGSFFTYRENQDKLALYDAKDNQKEELEQEDNILDKRKSKK
jgi:hypothetical protein